METIQNFIDTHPIWSILIVTGVTILGMSLRASFEEWVRSFRQIPADLNSDDVGGGL